MNEQLNLFAQSKQEYKINKPIRLIELFGGIGSQADPIGVHEADGVQRQGRASHAFHRDERFCHIPLRR